MNLYPLYMGPLDGLCVVYQQPPASLKVTQAFENVLISEFYSFDPALQKYVWCNHGDASAPIRITPTMPLSSNP